MGTAVDGQVAPVRYGAARLLLAAIDVDVDVAHGDERPQAHLCIKYPVVKSTGKSEGRLTEQGGPIGVDDLDHLGISGVQPVLDGPALVELLGRVQAHHLPSNSCSLQGKGDGRQFKTCLARPSRAAPTWPAMWTPKEKPMRLTLARGSPVSRL